MDVTATTRGGHGHEWRLMPAAVAVWAGTWWAVGARAQDVSTAAVVALAAAVLVTAAAAVAARLGRAVTAGVLSAVLVVLAALAVAGLAVSARLAPRQDGPVPVLAARGAAVSVLVTVTGDPRPAGFGDGIVVPARASITHRGQVQDRVPVLVVADGSWAGVRWDATYRAPATLAPPRDRADGVVASLRPRSPPVQVAPPGAVWRAAEAVRASLRLASRPLPSPAPGLVPALAVGDTSRLDPGVEADMRAAGLAHLSAVSGTNVTILCGGILMLAGLAGLRPWLRAVAAAVALAALVVTARPEPSVLRAAVMGAVGLLGLVAGRPGRAPATLSVAVLVLLVVDPWLARSYGFAMSAAATAGIVAGARPLAGRVPGIVPRPVAHALAVTVCAQAAVTPVTVLIDPDLPMWSVPANLLAGIVVAPTTISAVLAAVVSVVSVPAASVVALPAAVGCTWIALVGRAAAHGPGSAVALPDGPAGAAAAVALMGGAALALHAGAWVLRRTGPLRAGWDRPAGILPVILPVLLPVVLFASLLGPCAPGRPGRGWPGPDWLVVVCDVGQGESLLVRAGRDSAVVIDTGPDPAPLVACLRAARVREVPLLVLTHFHADHVGGLQGLLAAAPVGRVWHSPALAPAANAGEVAARLAASGVASSVPRVGDEFAVGGVRARVLWPDRVLDPSGAVAGEGSAINDASLVLRIEVGGLVLLALGDVETAAQAALARGAGQYLDADVVTIAHHGSASQVLAVYRAASASLAVASAGVDNPYGHPAPATVAMVGATGAEVAVTARDGGVAVTAGPDGSFRVGRQR